ncbi:carboxyl-terminal processing protease CtpA [Trichothermofontia sp.]
MHTRFIQLGLFVLLQLVCVLGLWSQPALALTDEQELVNEAWRIVNRSYLDATFNHQNWLRLRQKLLRQPLADRASAYAAIDQMLASLGDPFTRFLDPDQYRSLQVSTSGELTGVGLQITIDEPSGQLQVITPLEGSPAEAVGIQPLDYILKIDGEPTQGMSLDEAADRMRGPIGTQVVLTIAPNQAPQASPQNITVTRGRILLNPVTAQLHLTPQGTPIGYLRLSQFNANAVQELKRSLLTLEQSHPVGYVLDLRNNPGGLLQAGIEIARLWVDEGPIVYTVNRQGVLGSFDAMGSAITQAPLVVLVNQGTASASEILAGALQDSGRAILVGERTFGKGLIQSLFKLPDGSGMAVTVAKYETPNHHDIHQRGIQPDRVVPLPPLPRQQMGTEQDLQYQAAVDVLTQRTVLVGAA